MAHLAVVAAHNDGACKQSSVMRAHGLSITLHRKEAPHRETIGHQTSRASYTSEGSRSSWIHVRSPLPSSMLGRVHEANEVAETMPAPDPVQSA